MKTFTKHILLLALMIFGVAGAAWASRAPQKWTGPVDIATLVQGDTLAPGFSLICNGESKLRFPEGTVKINGSPREWDLYLDCSSINNFTYGSNGAMLLGSDAVTPAYGDWQDGNAWVVTDAYFDEFEQYYQVTLGGITIDLTPDPTVPALDELTGNWNFLMPGSNKVVKVTYKAEPALAWTFGDRAIPNDTTITAYRGFELPVIGNIGAIMNHDFYTALLGGTVSLRYGSTNPAVISFTNPNNMYSFSVNGAGECDVYMVFDGNDDFQDDSVAFHAVIANPYTLTLAANDYNMGSVSALVGGGEETLLTTITATSLTTYDETTPGIVTVTLDNIPAYNSTKGWRTGGSVTVEAAQGYTITRCLFKQGDKTPPVDNLAPFTATIVPDLDGPDGGYYVSVETSAGPVNRGDMSGITSIEVYGYASADSIVATATEGQYLVIPGATVQVVAEAQDGNYVSAWSDNRQPQHYTSDTATIVVNQSQTLTATFAQNPLLTLATDGQGSVELEGYTPGETTYDITIDGNTVTNVSFPYQTTVSLHNQLMQVNGANPVIINSFQSYGSADVTITISEPFDGSRTISYYYDEIGAPILGSKTITCTANHSDAVYPDGVTAGTTANSFRVLPGTQLSVTATPGEGSYLAQWSDQTEPVEGDARLGSSHPYTMPATEATLTATFNEIPVLTLASNNSEWGTVEMEGAGSGSSNGYTIKFSANGNTIVKENVTLPKTYQCEYGSPSEFDNIIRELYGWTGVHGNENAIPTVTGTDAITPGTESSSNYPKFTINSAFQGTATVTIGYTNSSWESDNWPIEISFVPALPAGVVAIGDNTYRVLPGAEVKVIATPDSAHYFVNWDEETALNSNTAVEKTLTMGTADAELTANFAAKPTLTLAHNDGGEMEIVPEEVMAVNEFTVPSSWNNDNTLVAATDLPSDFQSVSEAEARAWQNTTGHPVYLFFKAYASGTVAYVRFNANGTVADISTGLKSVIYNYVSDVYEGYLVRYTTVDAVSNVIASSTPNTYYIDYNTSVTVKADATELHHVKNWVDADSVAYPADSITYSNYFVTDPVALFPAHSTLRLTVTADTMTKAIFGINSYDVTASVAPTTDLRGTVRIASTDVQGAAQVSDSLATVTATAQGGSTSTLTAYPAWGYHFVEWQNQNGTQVSTDNPLAVTSAVDTALVAVFDTTKAELAWSDESFTGYTLIDFNNWAPTLTNSHNVEVRYGCVEGTLNVDAQSGIVGNEVAYGHIAHTPNTFHIYAVHDLSQEYFYDSVVYTLTVERGVVVNISQNNAEGGSAMFADRDSLPTLTHHYASGIMAFVAHGQTVDLVAEPAEGYHFTAWQEGNLVSGYTDIATSLEYTYTVPDATAAGLKAVFDTNVYNVTYTVQNDDRAEIGTGLPMGTVVLEGRHMHFLNDVLTATAAYGYTFAGWADQNGTIVSTENPLTLSPVSDTTLEATFTVNNYTLSSNMAIATSGQVTGAGSYPYRTNVTLEATPATGYHFVQWTNTQNTLNNPSNPITITVLGDTTLVAVMDTNVYTVSANVNIAGLGTVTGMGQVKHFLSTELVATANLGYHFVEWQNANSSVLGTTNSITVSPVSDTVLTAVFDTNIYATVWSGETTVIYTSQPYSGLVATYTDFWGTVHTPVLTFTNGSTVITTPNYPVTAGTWTVTATGEIGDSLTNPVVTLVIERATVYVSNAAVETAKFADGNTDAVVTNIGTLNNVQGSDAVTHNTVAAFSDATVGDNKTITLTYALVGNAALLANYNLTPATEVYTTSGYIIEPMTPDTEHQGDDTTVVEEGMDIYAYGYCNGSSYGIRYHLNSGNPDQYKIDFADSRFTDVDWTNLSTPGANGTIEVQVPVDLPTGDYSLTVTFRDSRFTWLESNPITVSFHVNLPETYTVVLFDNVIALVDTCHCFTDIQWYHRADATSTWEAIPGATGYYYREEGGLTGEYFVKVKMNGVETYTCPQTDMETLYSDTEEQVKVNVWPNPTHANVNVSIEGSLSATHDLRVLSTVGVEMEHRIFEGNSTTIDMSHYNRGNYMVTVDGVVVRVIRN